ncbi:MAG: TIGR00730 family Rossman fold protein [Eubacteriales bacterium]|nr:TIGR00730 family Rossman fold protein [Eubacteriales bacterium]
MNITVYLGANEGNDPTLREAVAELGTWIGSSGNRLIYGGSKCGLMGVLAENVIKAGGEAIGVEPQFFIDEELQYDELTELIVTKDMPERKAKMIELGDAFIAFPGGTGTLEEISEIMAMVSLGHLDAPCILYNLDGYYDSLKAFMNKMIEKGLSTVERQKGITFASTLDEIREILS